ncbi:MAG: acylphosphatase [Candidatus Acidiferrales bacterium]
MSDKLRNARDQECELAEVKVAKRYYASGAVQGVGYRYFAQRAGLRLGVAGYVKNLGDGRVEVYAVGSTAQLLALKQELERGPRTASVAEVMEEEAGVEEKYAQDFTVEHGAW